MGTDDDDGMPPSKPPQKMGYGNPPIHSRFKKGQPSANPKGRPRKNKAFQELVKDQLNRKVNLTINGKRRKVTLTEVALQQLVKKAVEGELGAIDRVIRLNELIEPLRPEPTMSGEELRQRQEMAENLANRLALQIDQMAAEKKAQAPRTYHPLQRRSEPDSTS